MFPIETLPLTPKHEHKTANTCPDRHPDRLGMWKSPPRHRSCVGQLHKSSQQRSWRLLPAKMYPWAGTPPTRLPVNPVMCPFHAKLQRCILEARLIEVAFIHNAIMPTTWICSGNSLGVRRLLPCAQLIACLLIVFAALYQARRQTVVGSQHASRTCCSAFCEPCHLQPCSQLSAIGGCVPCCRPLCLWRRSSRVDTTMIVLLSFSR
jgi:hypothetical protein